MGLTKRKIIEGCRRKQKHPSRGKAEAALRALETRYEGSTANMHVYPCPLGRHYHVGHRIGR